MDSTNIEGIEMYCPICLAPVTKVKEISQEEVKESECSNCYYVHKGKKLYKITNPESPLDKHLKNSI